MAYLAYNGKFLTRSSKWIGYDSVEPTPIIGDGIIRFRFYNADSPIDLKFLNTLTHNDGQWVQVCDVNTGLPIDGLWDYEYAFYAALPIRNLFSRMAPPNVHGADVDIIEIRDSRTVPVSDFWSNAFEDATALRKVHITQLTSEGSAIHMFNGCSSLLEAYVKCDTFTATEGMFYDCSSLRKIYLSTSDGLGTNMYGGCSSLSELTIEWTGSETGYYLSEGYTALASATLLTEVTLIHPYNVTVYLGGSSVNVQTFQNKTLLTHVHHLANHGNNVLVPDAIPITGQIERLFSGCTSLEEIPPLRAMRTIQCSNAFDGCRSVMSGILAAYDVLAPVTQQYQHHYTFRDCGIDTPQGSAELAQIPSDWK